MLHVRVVSPAARTESLTDLLAAAPGVHNLVVRAGAARRPPGDAVQFDVRDVAANPVLAALRALGLDRDGVICVERVDATLTSSVSRAADHGALRREKAPYSSWREARGSALQLLLNVVLLIVVGAAGLRAQRAIWRHRSPGQPDT